MSLSSMSAEKVTPAAGFAGAVVVELCASRAEASSIKIKTVEILHRLCMGILGSRFGDAGLGATRAEAGFFRQLPPTLHYEALIRFVRRETTDGVNMKSGRNGRNTRSKHLYVERQIFLGIFPDRLHQFARLDQHLIAVVVERGILEQHSGGALTLFKAG